MELKDKRVGFAVTGSFCTYALVMPIIKQIVDLGANVLTIVSFNAIEGAQNRVVCFIRQFPNNQLACLALNKSQQ